VVCLAIVGWDIWYVARAPGHPLNYLQSAWGLPLLAFPISVLAGSAMRVRMLIAISSGLVGVAVNVWDAAQAAGDWVNYLDAAVARSTLLAWWLASRRTRARRP